MKAEINPRTGKWFIQYRYTDWQGKRRKSTKRGFATKREAEEQQEILDDKIQTYINQGYSQPRAERTAKEWVALPGTSEYQLGIVVDIMQTNQSAVTKMFMYGLLRMLISMFHFEISTRKTGDYRDKL